MEAGFVWKDIHSSEKNFKIISLPSISTPEKRENKIIIPGRNGYVTETDNTYEGEIKPVTYDYLGDNFDDIKSWLSGDGNVVFSNGPDRYYKARIINKISLDLVLKKLHSGIVLFDCQPFGYNLDDNIITLTSPNTVFNPGNINSEPIIKVYGTGTIDLTINANLIHLTNVADYVTIDSKLVDCYKDTVLKNNYMSGEFPELIPGSNAITWIGTVTKIEITPTWRWR